jgi:hypothetical protein
MNKHLYVYAISIFPPLIYLFSPSLERFRYGNSDRYISYAEMNRIESFLKDKKFVSADTLTAEVILIAAGKLAKRNTEGEDRTVREERIKNKWVGKSDAEIFPCQYLLKLDDIWTRQTGKKFGFTTQAAIWEKIQVSRDPNQSAENFRSTVGWKNRTDPNAPYPAGFFPAQLYQQGTVAVPFFSKKLKECQKSEGN